MGRPDRVGKVAAMVAIGVGVVLFGVLTLPALAQEAGPSSRGKNVGFGAGLVIPQDPGVGSLDPTWWLTASFRFPLTDHLWLEPEIGYWEREPDSDLTLSRTVNLGANLLVSSQGRSLGAWAGLGIGLHLLVYQGFSASAAGEFIPGDDPFINPVPRLQLLAGVDYSLSDRTTLFGAGRLDTSFISEDDDLARQWKVYAGIRWRLQ
jgi:hypothetical protein